MFLRQLAPFFVFFFWYVSKKHGSGWLSCFFVVVFSVALLASYPKMEVAYLWVTYCLGVYVYGDHVSGDHVFAACYAVSSAHFGGWLYEVPFWHPASMFGSFSYPWVVNTQIVSGVFCLWLLIGKKIKVNKSMLCTGLLYVVLSVFYAVKPDHRVFMAFSLWWLPRIGTMLLLGSALTGLNHKH